MIPARTRRKRRPVVQELDTDLLETAVDSDVQEEI